MPRSICQKIRVQAIDFAISVRRIFTVTQYSGQDPEIPQQLEDPFWFGTDKAKTPPPQEYTLSIAIGF
jgi:hypothetical protein